MIEKIIYKKFLPKTGDVVEYHFTPDSVGLIKKGADGNIEPRTLTEGEELFVKAVDEHIDKADFSRHMNRSR